MSPVVYIFFNRPGVTRKTFGALREMRPSRLHLIADGPRLDRPGEIERCKETRAVVEGLIDWKCEVTRDYAEVNLGCGKRLSSGLTAAFALLGEAIVLEDDILPHPSFFAFCDAMLAEYRHEERVHAISGFQPLERFAPNCGPVVPSTFSGIWGWASWQRAWKDYRYDVSKDWNDPKVQAAIQAYLANDLNFHSLKRDLDEIASGRVDTWDFQWAYTLVAQRRVNLISSVNLIQNLGFDADATHTQNHELYLENLETRAAVQTRARRAIAQPDALHDKLYGEIIHGHSRNKIARLRLLARFPRLARPLFQLRHGLR